MERWLKSAIVIVTMLVALRADDLLMMTPSGPIRGTTVKSYTEKDVAVFYGIPYAKPPAGDLRFAAPIKAEPWKDELNATMPSMVCYQRISNSTEDIPNAILNELGGPKKSLSEDCLKLHIWVPIPRRTNSSVMVYIHGGGFRDGHPLVPVSSGATLAAEENIIVVSMNYRLHVQGFLYLGIPEAPGNMGLMDQQMALKWVRSNIASFGGNPDDVTIFGMSAGGASVGYQLLSPGSRDFFKRAILMSGTPNAVWAVRSKEEALDTSLKFANFLGCGSENVTKVFQCMRSVDANRLSDMESVTSSNRDLEFLPTVDGKFISDDLMNLLRKKEVKHADVMIGGVSDEGSMFMREFIPDMLNLGVGGISEQQFKSGVDSALKRYNSSTRKLISSIYTDWTRPGNPLMQRDAFKDIFSDFNFNCAAEDFADLYSATNNTMYRYVVDHRFTKLPFPKWFGTPHGFDTALHLGAATERGSWLWNSDDAIQSRTVMRWFANFARTGNPNGPGQSGPTWLKSTTSDKYYLRINANSAMEKHYKTQRCTRTKKILSVVAKKCHR